MFAPGTEIVGDGGIETMAALLQEHGHPDFATVMVGHDGIAWEFPGVSGFREALSDWISPYEEFRLVIDEVLVPEDKVAAFYLDQRGALEAAGINPDAPR